jgi:hypothetical protein
MTMRSFIHENPAAMRPLKPSEIWYITLLPVEVPHYLPAVPNSIRFLVYKVRKVEGILDFDLRKPPLELLDIPRISKCLDLSTSDGVLEYDV